MGIEAVRTPEERFANVTGFDYAPRYLEGLDGFDGLRLAYVDEGAPDAKHTFLCLHGQPTWSFLYRKMIPVFLEQPNHRVVAIDLFGFGRSDKPVDDNLYTFDFHRTTLLRAIERLELRNITLVCQDWGGIIGLTLPMEQPERFQRMIVMNTALTTGQVPPGEGFLSWKQFVADNPDFDIATLMKRAAPGISDADADAYAAPFPSAEYRAAVRRFPELVPINPEMAGADVSLQAAQWLSTQWNGASFMAVGVQDPVLGPKVMQRMRTVIRGCPEPLMLEQAGHFVQEHGDIVARAALDAFQSA